MLASIPERSQRGSSAAEKQPPSLRANARRERVRIAKAAAEVFAEQGIDAPVADVAARARIGKATVCRSWALGAVPGWERDRLHAKASAR